MNTKQFNVRIYTPKDAPFMGAYGSGSVQTGEAIVCVCLENLAGCIETREEFDSLVQETLAHEILHAIQEIYGQVFSEEQIIRAIHNPNELEICEDDEQMIQAMSRDIQRLHEQLEAAHDEIARLKA